MQVAHINGIRTHVSDPGPRDGQPLLFVNSLGTDLRIWDQLVARLPEGIRPIRYDMRGHGLTDCPGDAYWMGDLVGDAAALLDHLGLRGVTVMGLSIGGQVAQGLAAERPDLVSGLVLSNTAARIGNEADWEARIAALRTGGIAAMADAILDRWFSRRFRADHQDELAAWRNMLCRTPLDGYLGCCHAIAHTDLLESTSGLALPCLALAGSEDRATPADMVRETAGLIPGARFTVIRGAGHLPCIEAPDSVAAALIPFLALTDPARTDPARIDPEGDRS